jgi:cardiolipin synthase
MMHSKSMVVDDTISMIGSINLEPLSLDKLEEVALVSYDPALNRALAEDFEEDLKYAEEEDDD